MPSPAPVALILLFTIATTLLPGPDVAGYSHPVNPATIDSVVEKASLLLDVARSKPKGMMEALETLRPTLELVVRFFPSAEGHRQALQLLEQIEMLQRHQINCKKG